jgi:S-formylglutathione hydrolase FrmB
MTPVRDGKLSRRTLLIGGGAAAVTAALAAGGASSRPGRRALHQAGLLEADDHPAPSLDAARRATVRFSTIESEHMGREVAYAVATPAGLADDERAPLVFALHGRGGDERFAVESVRFQDFLAAAGVRAAVVAPNGGSSSYWHPRRNGSDPLGMLLDELVPLLEESLGNGTNALVGWSMGGYGALLAAERRPDRFVAVAATSPALFVEEDDAAPGAFDGPIDFRAHDVFTATDRLDGVTVRIDIGADDPFLGAVRRFGAGELHVQPGFHDAKFWRKVAPAQASFLKTHLA